MSRLANGLAAVLCLTATLVAGEPTRSPAEEFYPTRAGTRWVMRWTYFDGGEPTEDVIGVTEEKIVNGYRKWKVRIVGREVTANPLAGIVRALTDPPADDEIFEAWEFYDVDREAYVSRGDDEEGELPITLLWWPARAGDTFTDPDGITTTVIAEGRKVQVPAGTFECIVFETDYSGDSPAGTIALVDEEPAEEAPAAPFDEEAFDPIVTIEYWSKGVGLVQTEEYLVEGGKRTLSARQQLVSFHAPRERGKAVEPAAPAVAPPRPES